ncbi:hypothetical protein AMTR_s00117p00079990 [Amborella trichopoda]|uniref:Uncharacterized protein n=1 Tax=Amborella trichopoda TaxID=13333 RepID=W1NQC0_AMBTC|nr:hypothetical protein AMTR_s00117p00079990 [Amborella trichopoda]
METSRRKGKESRRSEGGLKKAKRVSEGGSGSFGRRGDLSKIRLLAGVSGLLGHQPATLLGGYKGGG